MGRPMLMILALLAGLLVAAFALQLIASESGEVVVLEVRDDDGVARTRLWVVEDDGALWLRAGSANSGWLQRLLAAPEVTLERDGQRGAYVAREEAQQIPRINELMAAKYGWRDWVISRYVPERAQAVAVRLEYPQHGDASRTALAPRRPRSQHGQDGLAYAEPAPDTDRLTMYRVVPFANVFLDATGAFLPGPPVDNAAIDRYVAPLNRSSSRIKRRILAENGIQTRHYAIDEQGSTRYSVTAMAAAAVRDCAAKGGEGAVGLLASASSGGDLLLPGLANQVQAELGWPPLATASHHGVCASGMLALADAARAVDRGEFDAAMVVASEAPSRLFKHSRFAPVDYDLDFDAHFLRWMLSDAAGAWRLTATPPVDRPALKLHFVHSVSHAGDYPLCMQMGLPHGGGEGWLDHASAAAAEDAGALLLRQDIRLLPHLFDVGIHAYAELVRGGAVDPDRIDHFLCHYSSERFRGLVKDCLDKAELTIPEQRWFSNLATRGNTGAASIFVMLNDFLAERALEPGQQILLFVPESGRFTVSFALLEVVAAGSHGSSRPSSWSLAAPTSDPAVPPPHDAAKVDPTRQPQLAKLLLELAGIWNDYRSRAWRSTPLRRIVSGRFSREDYLSWMAQWIPQVREGTGWMRRAMANLTPRFESLRSLIAEHADDEQGDYLILFEDYRRAGGSVEDIDTLRRNAGGEALHAFLEAKARQPDAIGLLGAIYIIEGSGQRLIPALLPLIRRQLPELGPVFRFLHYHGENDMAHLSRWLEAVEVVLDRAEDPDAAITEITRTARRTAELYLMQLEDAA